MVMEQEGSLLPLQDKANPPSSPLLVCPSHLRSLSRIGQGAAALSQLFPVLSAWAVPWSGGSPLLCLLSQYLHWGQILHTQTHPGTLLAKPLLATDAAQQPKGKA